MVAVCILDIEGDNNRVPALHVDFFERDAKQPIRHFEGTGPNVFEIEVRLGLVLVDIELRFPDLL